MFWNLTKARIPLLGTGIAQLKVGVTKGSSDLRACIARTYKGVNDVNSPIHDKSGLFTRAKSPKIPLRMVSFGGHSVHCSLLGNLEQQQRSQSVLVCEPPVRCARGIDSKSLRSFSLFRPSFHRWQGGAPVLCKSRS